jgi:hypothetical protein
VVKKYCFLQLRSSSTLKNGYIIVYNYSVVGKKAHF